MSEDSRRPLIFISYRIVDERWATWIAWQLEQAGYPAMVQAWDFVPGTNFVGRMHEGLADAAVVIAVLSKSYMTSRFTYLEWQSALLADTGTGNPAGKLIPVRVEECPLEGVLSAITYLDLVGAEDEDQARDRLLSRIEDALARRARPVAPPAFPPSGTAAAAPGEESPARPSGRSFSRLRPVGPPGYPPARREPVPSRDGIAVLHVPGPRFGRALPEADVPATAEELKDRIWADVSRLADAGAPRPDLLVVSGDLTESGGLREFDEAARFLAGLRAALTLEAGRCVIVPGGRDVTRAMCEAYFAECEADDIEPRPPYWKKWRHFSRAFGEFYRDMDGAVFDSSQPWTLFEIPGLQVVVAALNSTMAWSHRPEDRYGLIGEAQAAWFAERLRPYADSGWLRLGAVAHDPAVLRDGPVTAGLLGARLNLLLHGASGDGPAASGARPGSEGMLTVAAGRPGQHEILHLTADGLTRWRIPPDRGTPQAERSPREWRSARGTFPSPASGDTVELIVRPAPAGADGGRDPDTASGRAFSPEVQLLDKVIEVVEAGHPGAKLRRVMADGPPHVLVTEAQDGIVRQWRVAVHAAEVSREVIDEFAAVLRAGEPEDGAELVCSGPKVAQPLRDEARRRGIRVRSFTEFQGLLDLREYLDRQATDLEADQRYPRRLYVPQRFRELEADGSSPAGDDVVGEVLTEFSADAGRFVLLLADFGRGKTFALRELARRIPLELPTLIPIYIELRELDKAHSVEALVAAHLANHHEERIDLKAFRYMLAQGRIALLFDGFDELATRVTFDRAADHLRTLLAAAEGKAKIVVASRTQHFKSDAQVFTALGEQVSLLPGRRVLGIEDFGDSQISAYLRNWFSEDQQAAERLRLIRDVGNLRELAANPRMLSFITRLDESRLRAVSTAGRTLSGADLYRAILDEWLRFEHDRASGVPGAPAGLALSDRWRAVTMLAVRMAESGQTLIRVEELTAEVGRSLSGMASGHLSPEQRAHAIGAGSLLVRDEAGMFGFIHSSVAEWLVANEAAERLGGGPGGGEPDILGRQALSQLTIDFLCDLADSLALRTWMSRVLEDPGAPSAARTNAVRVSARLRVPEHADLRGAALRGENLSQRNFSGVDFTGADLTGAQLVGSNLSRAVLANARLRGARLDRARLDGADLTGADLGGARLTRTDLAGARLGGSSWNRASLIEVTGLPPGAAALPELHGAAIAPGQPVETEIAPAVVGVPHGYHPTIARLPQPLAYSADGSLIAVGHRDGGVSLCDTGTGRPVRTLRGHKARVFRVSYVAGDRLVVTAAADGTVRLWDTASGECARVLDVPGPGAWPVQASPDGRLLAYGAPDGVVRLADIAGGSVRLELGGHAELVYTLAFGAIPGGSGHEQVLLTGDHAGVIRIWDLASGERRAEFTIPGGEVYRLRACPGAAADPGLATMFAVGGAEGTLLLMDSRGYVTAELKGHAGAVYALAFHAGRRLLASGCTEGGVRLWDLAEPGRPAVLRPHPTALYGLSFSPDGALLASASRDGLVRITSLPDGQVRQELTAHKSAAWRPLFSPDGAQLATSGNDGTCRLWDVASGQQRHVLRGHGRQVTSVTFSSDGALLAASGNDGVVRVWDPVTGRQRHALTGTGDRLVSAEFGPVPGLLAAASSDGGVYLWNAATGAQEREMDVETTRVWAETFSPDGEVIATANDDDTVKLWSRPTGRNMLTIEEHKGRVRSLSFSPSGRLLATGCDDHGVRVWDIDSDVLVTSIPDHADRVYAVAFSPDGALLASAGLDGAVFLWDPRSGERVRRVTSGGGRLWTAAFSPDGRMLAVAGDDGAIRLWPVSGGDVLHVLEGHSDRVTAVAFGPDGALLASAADDGTVRVWDLTGPAPALRMTLLGSDTGWAAFAPDGRYKFGGDITGQFWHVIRACRFEPGELDPYLPAIRKLPDDTPFWPAG